MFYARSIQPYNTLKSVHRFEAAYRLDSKDIDRDLLKIIEKTNIEYLIKNATKKKIPKPEFLYHGSPVSGIKVLKPSSRTRPGVLKNKVFRAVYATDILSYACAFGFPWSNGEGFELIFTNDKVELGVPKQYKDRIQKPLFVYVVKGEYFELLPEAAPKGHNYFSKTPVPVERVTKYKSVKDALLKFECKIYFI